MNHLKNLNLAILSTAFLAFSCTNAEKNADAVMTEEEIITKAREVHETVITLDTHDDINTANFTLDNNYTMDLDTQVNLVKMDSGGLDVAWFIVYTGQGDLNEQGYAAAYENAIDKFNAIHLLAEAIAPEKVEIALTSHDVRRIVESGKKVAMIGIENGYPIGTNISRVEEFYNLGGRYMSLAHNGHSQLSDSNTGEADSVWLHNGLSELGKEVIAEMNRLGMMIDVSHPGKEAMKQMVALSKAPIIASHSAARALCNHSRNLDDEQLMLIKKNGGVVQTVAFASYVSEGKTKKRDSLIQIINKEVAAEMGFELLGSFREVRQLPEADRNTYIAKFREMRTKAEPRIQSEVDPVAPRVNVSDFADHIDYIVNLIGLDHVGISSDFDGGGGVEGWNNAAETFNVTLELVRRGYTQEEIAKLWSGNLLRVLDEVQAIAGQIQSETSQ
jgi:membrane dipeptidase